MERWGQTEDHAAVDRNERSGTWITNHEGNILYEPKAARIVDWSCIHITVRFLSIDVAEFELSYVSPFLGDEVHGEERFW